jgi:hypothetical protein
MTGLLTGSTIGTEVKVGGSAGLVPRTLLLRKLLGVEFVIAN